MGASKSTSGTRARGSNRRSFHASSIATRAGLIRAIDTASDSQSRARSSASTAAISAHPARPAKEAASRSCCLRSKRRRAADLPTSISIDAAVRMNIHSLMATRFAELDKEEAILNAALELFVERGFHGTTVPSVAERAGVAPGTIYHYFASKE